jgi:hypothetical protein
MKMEDLQRYQIFCDADGVIVDFQKKAIELVGSHKPVDQMTPTEKKHFWRAVARYEREGGRFWEEMDQMPDAFELWDYIKKYNPTILTASGTIGDAPDEKRIWVKKHLGANIKVIVTKASADKAQYAAPNHILIDDSNRSILPWNAAGGIGIFHRAASPTIMELQKLGL